MNKLSVLDCTLRDGGYINHFNFGEKTICHIIEKLTEANIDIIECGFLKSGKTDRNHSLYGSVSAIDKYFNKKSCNQLYVAMIAYGDITISEIDDYKPESIDGIRLTFHQKDMQDALEFAVHLMQKGYKVFIQPVGTVTYTDKELLYLVEMVNKIKPYAFYLVDTLGTMYKNDLLRMFYLIDNNLYKEIIVGFHSHNNLQLSFSNAQELLSIHTERKIIIDTSVLGMGRGAGNLCTELLTQYINENIERRYEITPILEIIDSDISAILKKMPWGYSVPYYLASINKCHPSYATYLIDKQTITMMQISNIIKQIAPEKASLFDEQYIEKLYTNYLRNNIDDKIALEKIAQLYDGKTVLILAPGKSLIEESEYLRGYISSKKPYIISVNFIPTNININTLFISNNKRFENIEDVLKSDIAKYTICTSNIVNYSESMLVVNYADYLNEENIISDNAGLMCINLLLKTGCRDIALAGFDGFSSNRGSNYYTSEMENDIGDDRILKMNKAITEKLKMLKRYINVHSVTKSLYIEGENEQ